MGSPGAIPHEGVCFLPGWLQKDQGSLGRTGMRRPVGLLRGLQRSLQGLGRGRKIWNRLQKAETLEHQVTYGDALRGECLCYQAFTVPGMASC